MMNVCPNCGTDVWNRLKEFVGLVRIVKDEENKYVIDANWFIPAKPLLCASCGYIRLFFEEPEDQNLNGSVNGGKSDG